jgi:hypothetical protein
MQRPRNDTVAARRVGCLLFCTENSIVNSPERGAAMPVGGFRENNNDDSDANREITSH